MTCKLLWLLCLPAITPDGYMISAAREVESCSQVVSCHGGLLPVKGLARAARLSRSGARDRVSTSSEQMARNRISGLTLREVL